MMAGLRWDSTPSAPTAIVVWETFTFTFLPPKMTILSTIIP